MSLYGIILLKAEPWHEYLVPCTASVLSWWGQNLLKQTKTAVYSVISQGLQLAIQKDSHLGALGELKS